MSAQDRHVADLSRATNQPSHQLSESKRWELSPWALFAIFLFPAGLAGFIVGGLNNWSDGGLLGGIVAFATAPTLAVVLTRWGQRWVGKEPPFKYAVLIVAVAFGGAVAGLAQVHVSQNRRCIDTTTYAVVPLDYCADTANSTSLVSTYSWYYGGSGTEIGQTAGGGSFSSTDGSGDVGGDVGADTGGGEGGGEG